MNGNLYFVAQSTAFLIILAFLSHEISRLVPGAYMDETFHISQALQYFNGNWFQWDPMITTPPGLYVLSVLILRLLSINESIYSLRLLNVATGVLVLLLARSICKSSHTTFPNERALLIALLPNLLIFFGLYYTDSGSVMLCLLAHWLLIKERFLLFLLTSLASLTFRQTNIIWVAVFSIFDQICLKVDGNLQLLWINREKHRKMALLSLSLFTIFAVGVSLNGGIALGDKQSHAVSLHLVQFFYFTSATVVFLWPLLVPSISKLRVTPFLIICAICFVSVRYGTIAHPYLLADNRHWTNFIWRRALKYEFIRYAFVPIHSISLLLMVHSLLSRGWLWVIGYFLSCAMVLVPSPLIEPRYYILPMVFFLFNCRIPSKRGLFIQFCNTLLINIFILGMFLYKPFENSDDRRIW